MKRALNHSALAACAALAAASVVSLPQMMMRRELERRQRAEAEGQASAGTVVIDRPTELAEGEILIIDDPARERRKTEYLREVIVLPAGLTEEDLERAIIRRHTPIAATLASVFPRPRRQAAYKQTITRFTSTPARRRGLTSAAKRRRVRRRQGR